MDSTLESPEMLLEARTGETTPDDEAVTTTDIRMDEIEEAAPAADDLNTNQSSKLTLDESMKTHHLPPNPDLEVLDETVFTWTIDGYRDLPKREHGPWFTCGGSSWRLLLFASGNHVDSVSLYLERQPVEPDEGSQDSGPKCACAQFALAMWNKNAPLNNVVQTASHRFDADGYDWGFTRFVETRKLASPNWEDSGRPLLENDTINISAYVRVYKDPTGVLWHNFINYDSKKETGLVGLRNQGATCYLNSLLQSLYFTTGFRKAVYQIPTEDDSERAKSPWALQRLFYMLQTSDDAVSTQELTHSFGWETRHIFEQQDVQELSRVLMERMEERMKGTDAEKALPRMFVGKMKTYISCINVDYESSRVEDFWDIQLNVSGNKNLDDSFKDYIQVETMDGENRYFAEGFGLQDARKGVIFESFPQILHLQLKRFEYDINRDAMMKVNDRYEFPATFDASPYLSDAADKSTPHIYSLHSVLVHSGDFNAGHYYAFLRPSADGQFYKFDDDRVTRATDKEAMDENFGGEFAAKTSYNETRNPYTRTVSSKRSMSAYMLVYVRQSSIPEMLPVITESDSPAHLAKQLNEEKAEMERKKKEREEQHLYISVGIVTERDFLAHQGFDLANWGQETRGTVSPHIYRLRRASTLSDLLSQLADELVIRPVCLRAWNMVSRQNRTIRPDQPLIDLDVTIEALAHKYSTRDKSFKLWIEEAKTFEGDRPIWSRVISTPRADDPLLIFLKRFDLSKQCLSGVGYVFLAKNSKVSDLLPFIKEKVAAAEEQIVLYEEIKNSMIEPMKLALTLHAAELQDGDIVCFQLTPSDTEREKILLNGGFVDAKDFYDYLLNRRQVTFFPRFVDDTNPVFKLDLSGKLSYEQMTSRVAEHLQVEATHLQFHTINATTKKAKTVVRMNASQNLAQILTPQFGNYGSSNQQDDALFYEVLEMSLLELESKKTIRVNYIFDAMAQEEVYDLLVPKTGTIRDLLLALQRKAGLTSIEHIRIYLVSNNRIHLEYSLNMLVQPISDYNVIVAEAVPEDDQNSELEISCFHFDKEPARAHGVPFWFSIKPGETFRDTKERLSKRISIRGKQFEKIQFALVQRSAYGKSEYIEDDDVLSEQVRSADLMLGLDHVNRTKMAGSKGDSMFIR